MGGRLMPITCCRMCGGAYRPVGRWDDPNICPSCRQSDFGAGPATSGYEPELARAPHLRGGAAVARQAHNLEAGGATPPPATTLPSAPFASSNVNPWLKPALPGQILPGRRAVGRFLDCWWQALAALPNVIQAEILTCPGGVAARELA